MNFGRLCTKWTGDEFVTSSKCQLAAVRSYYGYSTYTYMHRLKVSGDWARTHARTQERQIM